MINLSKRIFVLAAALTVALSSTAAFARSTTPVSEQGTVTIEQPAATATPEANTTEVETSPVVTVPTAVPTTQESNVIETGQTQKEMNKKYAGNWS